MKKLVNKFFKQKCYSKKYDAIIIGAGHNGLVCANYLAKSGMKKVLVIEKRHLVGIIEKNKK
jgi:ribulose 1,5-bisphosphate synthetase/thiazole synthase